MFTYWDGIERDWKLEAEKKKAQHTLSRMINLYTILTTCLQQLLQTRDDCSNGRYVVALVFHIPTW